MAHETPHDRLGEQQQDHLIELTRVLQTVEDELGKLPGESAALMRRSVQSALKYAPPLPAPEARQTDQER
jgi:hypothetical protein